MSVPTCIRPVTPVLARHTDTRETTNGPCPDCQGAGGRTEDTSSDGVTRETWIRCTTCHGTGSR